MVDRELARIRPPEKMLPCLLLYSLGEDSYETSFWFGPYCTAVECPVSVGRLRVPSLGLGLDLRPGQRYMCTILSTCECCYSVHVLLSLLLLLLRLLLLLGFRSFLLFTSPALYFIFDWPECPSTVVCFMPQSLQPSVPEYSYNRAINHTLAAREGEGIFIRDPCVPNTK